jgi:peptidoglycan hydrolase-like protein with peptidoglycan-binding domain
MKKVVYIFVLLAVPLSLNAYTFTRTLKVGSEGEDVRQLQIYLNSNPGTQVAQAGAGSPGSESIYFGERTMQAVIKMQNLFAPLILHPVGLSVGSGFVGNSTMSFLNNVLGNGATSSPQGVPSSGTPFIESVSPANVRDGDTITIIGRNFSDKNRITLTFEPNDAYVDIPSTGNGTRIEFTYNSSIQEPFDKKFKTIDKKAKEAVLEMFPKVPISVGVINKDGIISNQQSITFNLK